MRTLGFLFAVYTAASLLHFVHNAEYLADYPNIPASITRGAVYGTWLAQACVGVAGCLLLARGFRFAGLILVGAYAALGFDGLAHYALAPVSEHTIAMNATIWAEVVAGAALLSATGFLMLKGKAWRGS